MVDSLSLTAFRTRITDGIGHEAIGTSFLYRFEDRDWLVTAGHNVLAKHADTGDPLKPYEHGQYPDKLHAKVPTKVPQTNAPAGATMYGWNEISVSLWRGVKHEATIGDCSIGWLLA